MSDPVRTLAPERVYLDGDATIDEGYWPRCFGTPKPCSAPALEYIRADLVDALVAKERAACAKEAETEGWPGSMSVQHYNALTMYEEGGMDCAERIAAAIRARTP